METSVGYGGELSLRAPAERQAGVDLPTSEIDPSDPDAPERLGWSQATRGYLFQANQNLSRPAKNPVIRY